MQLRINTLLLICLLIGWSIIAYPVKNVSIETTRKKLDHIDKKIKQLHHAIKRTKNKYRLLNQELAQTEKQIGEGIHKRHTLQQQMAAKRNKMAALQKHITKQNTRLKKQQKLLAHHLKARYKIGEYQPLIILLSQDDPQKISRLLTYYQYLMRSRQTSIDDLKTLAKSLKDNQKELKSELESQRILKNKWQIEQKNLEGNKRYQESVIRSLNKKIKNNQQKLIEFEQNKANLSRLLQTLKQHRPKKTSPHGASFAELKHRLPYPVYVKGKKITKMHQGVMFIVPEGTAVHAVYSGRIVFSDWLKGYGLLLIIDHGHGFMTLYAHNQAFFKQKGSLVTQGEQISTVGHTGGLKQNGLYFEVRQRGKAVPPLKWLS